MAVGSFLVTDRAREPHAVHKQQESRPRGLSVGTQGTGGARGLTLPGALEEQTLVCPGRAALSQVRGSLQAGSPGVCLI